jgi:hypothetical protein
VPVQAERVPWNLIQIMLAKGGLPQRAPVFAMSR